MSHIHEKVWEEPVEVSDLPCFSVVINQNCFLTTGSVEKEALFSNPFSAAKYTDNGKINRSVLLCWPVNQKTVIGAKAVFVLRGREYFCRVGQPRSHSTLGLSCGFGVGSVVPRAGSATMRARLLCCRQ